MGQVLYGCAITTVAALWSNVFSLENTCSMGLRSGL